jgi:UDPglucose--hexose-1-phosphate uridylyltransferase
MSLKRVERMENATSANMKCDRTASAEEWVIYAPERRIRPHAARDPLPPTLPVPDRDPSAALSAGNEQLLPAIRMEMHGAKGWQVRAVPNLYPALSRNGTGAETMVGIYRMMQGYGDRGHHRDPLHNRPISLMSADEGVELLIEAYHRRYVKWHQSKIKTVILFRNHAVPWRAPLWPRLISQLMGAGIIPIREAPGTIGCRSFFMKKAGACF